MKTRDEKGRFAPTHEEMTDEQREAICYKSKLLNKYFDDYDKLVQEEDAYKKAHEVELKAKEERKAESEAVKLAVAERVEAEIEARKVKAEAYKAYCEACDKADETVKAKRKVEQEKLTEFCKKHPEGFHDTIKIGDVTYKFDYSTNVTSYVDPLMKLLTWF